MMESRASISTLDEPNIPRHVPFKLCFVIKKETGRSNVKIDKPLKCRK